MPNFSTDCHHISKHEHEIIQIADFTHLALMQHL